MRTLAASQLPMAGSGDRRVNQWAMDTVNHLVMSAGRTNEDVQKAVEEMQSPADGRAQGAVMLRRMQLAQADPLFSFDLAGSVRAPPCTWPASATPSSRSWRCAPAHSGGSLPTAVVVCRRVGILGSIASRMPDWERSACCGFILICSRLIGPASMRSTMRLAGIGGENAALGVCIAVIRILDIPGLSGLFVALHSHKQACSSAPSRHHLIFVKRSESAACVQAVEWTDSPVSAELRAMLNDGMSNN